MFLGDGRREKQSILPTWMLFSCSSSQNNTAIIAIIIIVVVVAVVIAAVLVFKLRKRSESVSFAFLFLLSFAFFSLLLFQFEETTNEMSSRFAEISEKTTNKEMLEEINMLPSFSSLSQLNLSCGVDEIIFKDSLEVCNDTHSPIHSFTQQ